jgi:hypothetical protein
MKHLAQYFPLVPLAMIFAGVSSLWTMGVGAIVVGSLIWIDLSLESYTNGRTRKHDGH